MTPLVFQSAVEIISQAGRNEPADAVLRRASSSIKSKEDRQRIARAVFCFYRWRGWVDPDCLTREPLGDQPDVQLGPRQLEDRIVEAIALQDQFNTDPSHFTQEDLARRCVPAWISQYIPLSPDWLRSLQAEPHIWVRAKDGTAESLAWKLGPCQPAGKGALRHALEYRGKDDLFGSPAFHAGEFEIQDIASQLVSLLLAPQPNEKWWDACAGEGGKTLHLSDLMQNMGLIVASDRADWRLAKLKRRAARAGMFNYRAALWDGGRKLPTKTAFDGVLIDAPCSGAGTWQKNPHARWTTRPNDILELRDKQLALLTHASAAVKPGGKLAYAVCTLTRPETTEITQSFNQLHVSDGKFIPLSLELSDGEFKSRGCEHLWWPHQIRGNGMYVSLWQRAE